MADPPAHTTSLLADLDFIRKDHAMLPTIGRIVHYTLSEQDAAIISSDRSSDTDLIQRRYNPVSSGDTFPAMVVRTFGGDAANLQVQLDGNDTYWATSRGEGQAGEHGKWIWPPRV